MGMATKRGGAILALALVLAGCQSTDWRLYVEARDKQGQAAKTAWDAVNFDATVKTERDNLNKFMQAEIDTAAKTRVAVRDDYLRYLVGSTLQKGLADQLKAKHETLVGTDDVASTVKLAVAADANKLDLSGVVLFFALNNLGPATCDYAAPNVSPQMRKAQASSDATTAGLAGQGIAQLNKACKAKNAPGLEDSFKGGVLAKYVNGRKNAQRELDDLTIEAKTLTDNYEQAKDAFDKAAMAKAVDTVKNLKDKAQKLADAANKLSASSNPLAQQFMANEGIQALNDFVKALAATPADPSQVPSADSGAAKAAVALAIFPRLMDEATQAANEQRAMRAVPLQMQANYQQLILTAATRDIQSRQAEVKLWDQLVTATLDEAVQLSRAYNRLNLFGPPAGSSQTAALKDWADKPVIELTTGTKATTDQRELFYFSAGLYADALTRLDTARDTLQIKVRAAIYERALAYSEVNAKQWTSLIGLSVDQVSASAASGLKSQTVTNLLNTLALLGGAYGLNNK